MLVLKICFYLVGASAIGIAGSNFLFGIATTAGWFGALFELLGAPPSNIGDLSTANVDSEFRFYSVFWGAYGVLLIDTARRLPEATGRAGLLIGLFFLGGVGRTLSYAAYGLPTALFVILTAVEIVVSLVMVAAWATMQRSATAERVS